MAKVSSGKAAPFVEKEAKKQCSICKEHKTLEKFYKSKQHKYGVCSRCKECDTKYIKEKKKNWNYEISVNEKKCSKCCEIKVFTEFPKNKKIKDGLHTVCKQCKKLYDKEYNKERRDLSRHQIYKQSKRGKFSIYKRNAKNRDIAFEISFEDFSKFWQAHCYYCNDKIITIGIDRIDNSLGYSLDNIIPCCEWCNKMKLASKQDEFFTHIKKIFKNRIEND